MKGGVCHGNESKAPASGFRDPADRYAFAGLGASQTGRKRRIPLAVHPGLGHFDLCGHGGHGSLFLSIGHNENTSKKKQRLYKGGVHKTVKPLYEAIRAEVSL